MEYIIEHKFCQKIRKSLKQARTELGQAQIGRIENGNVDS